MQINVDYSADETRWALFECVFVALLVSPFSAAIYVKEMAGSFSLFLFIFFFFYFDFLLRVWNKPVKTDASFFIVIYLRRRPVTFYSTGVLEALAVAFSTVNAVDNLGSAVAEEEEAVEEE